MNSFGRERLLINKGENSVIVVTLVELFQAVVCESSNSYRQTASYFIDKHKQRIYLYTNPRLKKFANTAFSLFLLGIRIAIFTTVELKNPRTLAMMALLCQENLSLSQSIRVRP